MAKLCSLDAILNISPAHHHRTFNQTIVQHLIPANKLTTASVNNICNTLCKILLQFILVLQAIFKHKLLSFSRLLPPLFGALICTDMDILAGKDIHQLVENILQKLENLLRRSKHIVLAVIDAPGYCRLFRNFRGCAKVRICCNDCHRVARHVNFRNHSDIALRSVLHNLLHLRNCVEPTVTSAVYAGSGKNSDNRAGPPGANLIEQRVTFTLHSPTLVVCKVPVKIVHLVQSQIIYILFHIIY